jgi:hypothetical protein
VGNKTDVKRGQKLEIPNMVRILLKALRHPVVLLSAATIIVIALVGSGLFAQGPGNLSRLGATSSLEPSSSTESTELLPAIPGAPIPTSTPDDTKTLDGYSGPFYDVTNLDGQVTVLRDSVYTWANTTWKAFGLVRNQTRNPIQVTSLVVRLLGSEGQLLDAVEATLPVDELRPGEPGPFLIESHIPKEEIKSIDWHLDYKPIELAKRTIKFGSNKAVISPNLTYSLSGLISNEASSSARSVRVIAAWLDRQGRVLYMSPTNIHISSDSNGRKSEYELLPGDYATFYYSTNDPWLISLIENAQFALWGESK